MKNYYSVSFQNRSGIYCVNIAHAETVEDVRRHYSDRELFSISNADSYEVEEAQRRHMPIVEIEHENEDEEKQEEKKMEAYDYREAVKNDVLEYIKNEIDFEDFDSLEELEEKLNDDLFAEDSVTGNASGSYTFSTWEAEENLCHNLDLLGEALEEFGSGADYLITHGAEAADVTIRCYLLGECIAEALEEIEDDFNEAHEDEETEE